MPSWRVSASQTEKQNCLPLSEVTCSGTPNLATQPPIRASVQHAAEVDRRGIASAQRLDLSTTVNRCVKPSLEAGRGPTRSVWMWLNRWMGLAMSPGCETGWEVTLARWQGWQSRHQAATCDASPGQTKWLEISRCVALIPGCARLCTALKMGRQKAAGTRGLKTPEEVSTRMIEPCREIADTRRAGALASRLCRRQRG